MNTKTTWIIIAIFVALSFGLSLALSSYFPDQMASHWNEAGQVDGYSNKFMGLFFMPLIQLAVAALVTGIPAMDPMRKNIAAFRGTYNLFTVAIVGFLTYMHILTLVWNLGFPMNMTLWITPAFAVLFFVAGHVLGKARQNYMIGIRTPWTLANTVVWDDTHRVGGVVFKICAIISLVGMLFPDIAFFFMIGPILVGALGLVIYSYVRFVQIGRNTP